MIKVITSAPLVEDSSIEYTDLTDFENFLNEHPRHLALDTETSGLNPRQDVLHSIQVGTPKDQYIIIWKYLTEPGKKRVRKAISEYNGVFVLHNAKFDAQFLLAQSIPLKNVFDTMLAELVLDTGRAHRRSLSHIAAHYLDVVLLKDTRKDFLRKDYDFDLRALHYGAKDVEYLLPIRERQVQRLKRAKLDLVAKLESKASLAFADIEYNGMMLDIPMWEKIYKENLEQSIQLELDICRMLFEDHTFDGLFQGSPQIDMFKSEDEIKMVNINLNSAKQLLPVLKRIDFTATDTKAETIERLKHMHPVADLLDQYKGLRKLVTTYGSKFLKLVENGKVHTDINQILETGRISSSAPNMQQLPGNNRYRNCFIAPQGWSYASADYASQELCVIAVGSGDPQWLDALEKGQDLHSVSAELIYDSVWVFAAEDDCAFYKQGKKKCSCSEHMKLRENVKAINFGLAYGLEAQGLARRLEITPAEAEELINTYFKTFPRIKNFLNTLAAFGKKNGYIRTYKPFRRVRWFPEWKPGIRDKMVLGSIGRRSKNQPIQGTSADMVKLALCYIKEFIIEHKVPVKIVMTVHDQIDTICADSYKSTWEPQLKKLMEKAAKDVLGTNLLKADITSGPRWSK